MNDEEFEEDREFEEHRFCSDEGTFVLRRVGSERRWYLGILEGNQTEGDPDTLVLVTDRQAREISDLLLGQVQDVRE